MSHLLSEVSQGQVTAHIVRSFAGFKALREQWNTLFESAHNPSPPLHYDWIWNWLQVNGGRYVDGREGLRLICCRRAGQLVGLLPLYQRHALSVTDGGRHLRFLSTGELERDEICPDYTDLLCLAEVKEQCAELTGQTLCGDLARTYDRLELSDMADHATFASWARANGAEYDLQIIPRGVCPIADLSGGFEAYLTRLSANTRQQVRRLMRAATRAGVEIQPASTVEQAYGFFQELAELHQKRWEAAGKPGCFSSPSFTAFHRQLIRDWLPSGKVVLTRIRLGDTTLAVKYGFRFGEKFDFYQAGVLAQDSSSIKSPGIVSFILLMQYLISRGVTCFDFLRGSSNYKQRLATTAQPLVCVRKVRWTIGTTVGFVTDLGVRGIRRAGRLASGRTPAADARKPHPD